MSIQYLTDDKGTRTGVLISIDEYEEILEDIHDLAITAERKDESTVNMDDLKAKLKADGLI